MSNNRYSFRVRPAPADSNSDPKAVGAKSSPMACSTTRRSRAPSKPKAKSKPARPQPTVIPNRLDPGYAAPVRLSASSVHNRHTFLPRNPAPPPTDRLHPNYAAPVRLSASNVHNKHTFVPHNRAPPSHRQATSIRDGDESDSDNDTDMEDKEDSENESIDGDQNAESMDLEDGDTGDTDDFSEDDSEGDLPTAPATVHVFPTRALRATNLAPKIATRKGHGGRGVKREFADLTRDSAEPGQIVYKEISEDQGRRLAGLPPRKRARVTID